MVYWQLVLDRRGTIKTGGFVLPGANAVYIHLTGDPLTPGRTTIRATLRQAPHGSSRLNRGADLRRSRVQ